MLTASQIKQASELTEEFTFVDKSEDSRLRESYLAYYDHKCSVVGLAMPHAIFYNNFLQSVIEGINEGEEFEIHTTRSNHLIFSKVEHTKLPEEIPLDDTYIRYSYGDYVHDVMLDRLENDITYPTFLQEVIEGLNKAFAEGEQDQFYISQSDEGIEVFNASDHLISNHEDLNTIKQGKEKVIKLVLGKL